jgi:phosphoadenosine phosphosulfate reductase
MKDFFRPEAESSKREAPAPRDITPSQLGALPNSILTVREAAELDKQFATQDSTAILAWAANYFGRRAAIGTSFQGSGLVMMHLAKQAGLSFPVFTLDTGLLFPQTTELQKRLEDFYGWKIESLQPDISVEQQAEAQGPDLWSRDPDLCCTIRKVLPLQSKLRELGCWITGLRRAQSETRAAIGIIELYALDRQADGQIVKLNPMARWSREDIWQYIHQHKIPYNPLHDEGYRSIGCMTCTRKTGQGEGERAGRWTGFKKVECGIHTFLSKKVDFQI